MSEVSRKASAKSKPFSPGIITSSTMISNDRLESRARASEAEATAVTR